ncbi:MAG: transposase [Methylococcaceae bacterium]|nr:transposase [Methylococcaceae bacterium]
MKQLANQEGNCWDNAPTGRFFRNLKHGQLNYESFRAKEAATLSIIDYLAFYNGRRTHSTLGYQSPLCLSGNSIGKLPRKVSGFT